VRNDLKPRGFSKAFRIPMLLKRPEKRMRPAVIDQRFGNFLFPLLARNFKMTKTHTMDRFFGNFIAQHLTRQKPARPMRHFRLTN
jgi:hypothetical protein